MSKNKNLCSTKLLIHQKKCTGRIILPLPFSKSSENGNKKYNFDTELDHYPFSMGVENDAKDRNLYPTKFLTV